MGSSPYFYPDFDYQNGGLLFQFVLEEYMRAHSVVAELCVALAQFRHPSEDGAYNLEALDLLEEKIFSLLTTSPTTPWTNGASCLSKLHEHCLLLNARSAIADGPSCRLCRAIDRTIQEAVRCQQTLSQGGAACPQAVMDALAARIERIQAHLGRSGEHLLRCLQEFGEDENVIYFVLRRYRDLAQALGEDALGKRLKRMDKNGIQGLLNFLATRYTERGFGHLVPQIEQLYIDV